MTTNKEFKSVAVEKKVWEQLWQSADAESRTPAHQIKWFVKNYKKIEKLLREHGQ